MSEPITVHIGETKTRYTKPLCKRGTRPSTYVPGVNEQTWVLAAAKPPARVQLGGTGFTVPVSMMAQVQAQRGRTVKTCGPCLKALAGMSDRLKV
jgi:hypothetical protein